MGILNYLRGVFRQDGMARYAAWLSNSEPVFSSFGKNIYLSDFVNNAIDRVASEISKIEVKSVVERDDTVAVQNDDLTRLLRFKPNPLQTTSDFLSCVEWIRRKNRNAFIYPQYDVIYDPSGRVYKRYTALYPLNPMSIYIGVDGFGTAWEVQMNFQDGSSYTLPYADLIHLRWRRGANTIIGGGDDYGQANDYDVVRTIDALDKTIQGLPKSIEASLQIKGVYSTKSLLDNDRRAKERDDFESHIMTSKEGIIATDLAGEFTPVNISAPAIPEETMRFLKTILRQRYGISEKILDGDYNGEEHSAFYQSVIEDFIVQFEQAATACLFTPREQDVGHRIKCYYSKVNYLAIKDKIELAQLARDTGIMTLNQINEMFGLEPFDGGDRRLQSLNYVNVNNVDLYQTGGLNNEQGA